MDTPISSWEEFEAHTSEQNTDRLAKIGDFPDAVHVIGCQRSGTTMLARILAANKGIEHFNYGNGHELDSALILSGLVRHEVSGRHCFQTTYLNESVEEYFHHTPNYRMVWVLRNPQSVVYSMLNNWKPRALDALFEECGQTRLTGTRAITYRILTAPGLRRIQEAFFSYNGKGNRFLQKARIPKDALMLTDYKAHRLYCGVSRLERACLSYNARVQQLFDLWDYLDTEQIVVVDYDHLVRNRKALMRALYDFLDLTYDPKSLDDISTGSLLKSSQFSHEERAFVEDTCGPIYDRARELVSFRVPASFKQQSPHYLP